MTAGIRSHIISLLTLLLPWATQPLQGQAPLPKADSLIDIILHHSNDSIRLHALYTLDKTYGYKDPALVFKYIDIQVQIGIRMQSPRIQVIGNINKGGLSVQMGKNDSAVHFYKAAEAAFEASLDSIFLVDIYDGLGRVHLRMADYTAASHYFEASKKLSASLGDHFGQGQAANSLGRIYYLRGEYENTLAAYQESLEYFRLAGDTRNVGVLLTGIGQVYADMDLNEAALSYFGESKAIFATLNYLPGQAAISRSLGSFWREQNEFDSALHYHFRALTINEQLEEPYQVGESYYHLGFVYLNMGAYPKALGAFLQAQSIQESLPDSNGLAFTLFGLTETRLRMGDTLGAFADLQRGQSMEFLIDNPSMREEVYRLWHPVLAARGEYGTAIEMQRRLSAVKESMANTALLLQVAGRESRYKQRLQSAAMDQALQSQEVAHLKILQRSLMLMVLGIGLLVGMLIWRRRNKLKFQAMQLVIARITAEKETKEVELEQVLIEKRRIEAELQVELQALNHHALHLAQKNESLQRVKTALQAIDKADQSIEVKELMRQIDQSFYLDRDWDGFHKHFEHLHPQFFPKLQQLYPDLRQADLRLAALLRLDFSPQDAAEILGISTDSWKTARYRLRKKMHLPDTEHLRQALLKII